MLFRKLWQVGECPRIGFLAWLVPGMVLCLCGLVTNTVRGEDASCAVLPEIYSSDEIGNHSLIHAVAVDGRGRVFAAVPDDNRIHVFDGATWRAHELPRSPMSLAVDQDGQVWAGLVNGVCCCFFDRAGQFQFQMMEIDFLPDDNRTMLNATTIANDVVFYNAQITVRFRSGNVSIERAPDGTSFLSLGDHSVFVRQPDDEGIIRIWHGSRQSVRSLEDQRIEYVMELHDQSVLVMNSRNQLILNRRDQSEVFSPALQQRLLSPEGACQIFWVEQFDNENIGIGTTCGYFECKPDGKIVRFIGEKEGLNDPFIGQVYEASTGDIWLVNDRNLVRLPRPNGINEFKFTERHATPFDFRRFGETFYVATDYGIFSLKENPDGLFESRLVAGLPQCVGHDIRKIGDSMFAATSDGLYRIRDGRAELLLEGWYTGLVYIKETGQLLTVDFGGNGDRCPLQR